MTRYSSKITEYDLYQHENNLYKRMIVVTAGLYESYPITMR
jgi:hypothetical protein